MARNSHNCLMIFIWFVTFIYIVVFTTVISNMPWKIAIGFTKTVNELGIT